MSIERTNGWVIQRKEPLFEGSFHMVWNDLETVPQVFTKKQEALHYFDTFLADLPVQHRVVSTPGYIERD